MMDLWLKKLHLFVRPFIVRSAGARYICGIPHIVKETTSIPSVVSCVEPLGYRGKCGRKYLSQTAMMRQGENGSMEVAGMRKAYKGKQDVFDLGNLVAKEPFGQFSAWFEEAKTTQGIMEANAMALATASRDGTPSVRMVLMKGLDERGIVFYTNFHSHKGQDLVRIEGKVERVSDEESTQYFHSRPRSSQIGACVSIRQSDLIESREALDKRNDDLNAQYSDESVPVPKPDYWGGFRVVPHRFEFWQGQTNRIHDRIIFRKPDKGEAIDTKFTHQGEKGWVLERLMP